ncbi:MAG: hypothetical protein HY706_08225 [Candidatus Hydrogenedentes bacterium]|nr:hypothetical protein [Candidatus Hydrogenedentota bacterium]
MKPANTLTFPPPIPIAELGEWSQQLGAISAQPLEFCEEFPKIAQRFEAWWSHDVLDRPIFLATANRDPSRPITRRLEFLENADAWFETKFRDLQQTHRVGDALPNIRVDFGPVLLGGMLGGRLEFGAGTGWTHAFVNDDWSNAPDWVLRDDNHWWQILLNLTRLVAEHARGRYLVCTPDLGGSADVLLNLRGSATLCTDVIEQPEQITRAVEAIYPSWHKAFTELYRSALGPGAGLIHWLGLWSNRPYLVPACDFNFMIGPDEFNRLFLPDIARQATTVERSVFHLDGPGAAKHIDALLEVADMQAIQFTPGTGTPSALAWLDMFRKIQAHGKSLLIFCPADEVLPLCEELHPEGLALQLDAVLSPAELDQLFTAFCGTSTAQCGY